MSAVVNLLQIAQLRGGYSDVDIIHGIDLAVAPGEIVTIAGTNGAGKSTVVKALLGLLPRVSGTVLLNGRDITRLSAEDRFDAGLAYVPQVANVFPSLTVRENLLVVRGVPNVRRRMDEVLVDFPALVERLPQSAGDLSGGERQQLAFARALMPSPRIMVLDEPTAALAPSLVGKVFDMVRKLPASGVAVLMVEQRARQALQISHQGYILDQGRCVLQGQAQALLGDERMAQLYLGNH
ncbi:ABC transporter ATP-binding protein [Variovorax ginsengisoli]|uniref:Branched-chain amino acid transport system ATP-binding protein n=1 Tax=Variovorax ginsengisoli TaxID=363844 RepID=A0ABT9S6K8_9BURK|nr:ABC transporter ATP-binding protein [Variovorax ginsengisoli]MDP9899994.1 branched-chain amino acid transport system ATP-binding protein [Variovorax ginsengisoli]